MVESSSAPNRVELPRARAIAPSSTSSSAHSAVITIVADDQLRPGRRSRASRRSRRRVPSDRDRVRGDADARPAPRPMGSNAARTPLLNVPKIFAIAPRAYRRGGPPRARAGPDRPTPCRGPLCGRARSRLCRSTGGAVIATVVADVTAPTQRPGGRRMAQKTQEKGVTGPAPVVDAPEQGAQRGAGRATPGRGRRRSSRRCWPRPGRSRAPARSTEGTTVCDHDPAAVRQQRSVSPRLRPVRCTTGSRSTCSTPPATPTSSASCGPACAPPTPRCSWSPRSTGWTPPPPRSGRSAPRSACPGRSRSPGSTTSGPTSTRRWPSAGGCSATACCRSTCRCTATTGERSAGLIGLITQRVFDYSGGHPPSRPRARRRAPAGDRGRRATS